MHTFHEYNERTHTILLTTKEFPIQPNTYIFKCFFKTLKNRLEKHYHQHYNFSIDEKIFSLTENRTRVIRRYSRTLYPPNYRTLHVVVIAGCQLYRTNRSVREPFGTILFNWPVTRTRYTFSPDNQLSNLPRLPGQIAIIGGAMRTLKRNFYFSLRQITFPARACTGVRGKQRGKFLTLSVLSILSISTNQEATRPDR